MVLSDDTVVVLTDGMMNKSVHDVVSGIDAMVTELTVAGKTNLANTYIGYMKNNFFAAWNTDALVAANQSLKDWNFVNVNPAEDVQVPNEV